MRFLRIGEFGNEVPVVFHEDVYFDLAPLLPNGDIDGEFFSRGGYESVRRSLESGSLEECPAAGRRIGAPIARPSAVICIGQNYAAHALESGSPIPERPVLFFKHPNTVVGPFDDVVIPLGADRVDWEVELGVVIGRRCRYLPSPTAARAHVAGYTISNDVSERRFQLELSGGQWSKGKSCETFNPLGPWLIPAEELPDVQALGIRSWVDGAIRQESNTSDMIFSIDNLIYELSHYLVLEPGDLVNTGTPEGVALSGRFPYLTPGAVMELEIDKLGRQRQVLRPSSGDVSDGHSLHEGNEEAASRS